MNYDPNDASFVGDHGLSVNEQGRAYSNGKSLSFEEKVEVGRVILFNMDENGSINRSAPRRSISLSGLDMFVLLQMWRNDPTTSLKMYAQGLNLITGTVVHPSTISRWFLYCFHISGTMCRTNMVPFDKFRPENYEKALMYMSVISVVNPGAIKFGDKKHLEGKDLYNRKVRKSVLTGEVPAILTHPDFRERYTIVGFCGIDPR
eukprot:scaffold186882_cov23-Cyclotella_meneghiniana.AAC.1